MTVRIAHQSHRWNHATAECRLCACSSATPEAQAPCPKASASGAATARPRTPGTPDIHKLALAHARDLVRK